MLGLEHPRPIGSVRQSLSFRLVSTPELDHPHDDEGNAEKRHQGGGYLGELLEDGVGVRRVVRIRSARLEFPVVTPYPLSKAETD